MPLLPENIVCMPCGHTLAGVDLQGTCPACNRPVSYTLNPAALDPSTLTVRVDVPCVECGYNLRMQPIGGLCPECAHVVVAALEPGDLRFADPAWLRKVREGITLVLVALAGYVLGTMILMIVVTALTASSNPPAFEPAFSWVAVLTVILGVTGVGGLLLITAIEPDPKGRPCSPFPNLAARWIIVLSFLAAILWWAWWTLPDAPDVLPPSLSIASAAGTSLASASAVILVSICLRRLAIRARRRGLRRLTTTMIWLTAVGSVWYCAMQVFVVLAMPQLQALATMPPASGSSAPTSGPGTAPVPVAVVSSPTTGGTVVTGRPGIPAVPARWMIWFGFVSCGAGLLMVVSFILTVVMLAMYRNMLTTAIAAEGGNTTG